jgi:hypothetical protein
MDQNGPFSSMFHSKDFNASTGWSIVHHLFWVHTPSVCSSSIYLKASRMATSMRIGGSISSTWRRVRWILFVILSNVDTTDSPKWSHIDASKIWWFPDLWGTHKSSPFMVFSIAKNPSIWGTLWKPSYRPWKMSCGLLCITKVGAMHGSARLPVWCWLQGILQYFSSWDEERDR